MLFSINAALRKVHGYHMLFVGIEVRYGIAHSGLDRYVEGDVTTCCSGVAVPTQDRNRKPAFSVDNEMSASMIIRVTGGRLIRGGMFA